LFSLNNITSFLLYSYTISYYLVYIIYGNVINSINRNVVLPKLFLLDPINIYLGTLTKLLMISDRLFTVVKINAGIIALAILALLIIVLGGIGVYLAEHGNPRANITNLGDAFWWAIATITTVGYGDYYPVTAVGRAIAIIVMFSGIGVFLLFVSTLAERRFKRAESRFKSTAQVELTLQGHEFKRAIKNKIDEIEMLNEEDFDKLIITMKGVRRSLLDYKNLYKCSRCGSVYHTKPKFCSNCGLELA
jgi:voltage-gated potassium channel